ncbi:uncharacterized protein JCM10292_000294 [Rhodotorula paludigena]|uniref:uncharacterized protein n=1 Tax=Rhodotorula paludigena TaxID=86838 RepID=UPI003181E9D8
MRAKKPAARRPSVPPVEDPFYVGPAASPTTASSPFSAAAFDQYMGLGIQNAQSARAVGAAKEASGSGLGKKLLSFPWTRQDKKHAVAHQQEIADESLSRSSRADGAPPASPVLQATASLPLGFPAPPPATPADVLARARQHPSFAAITKHVPGHPQSNSSLSTIRTTSSFASTALFVSSEDGDWSEATTLSLTSSPESGRDSAGENGTPSHLRMWRVKGLKAEPPSTLPDIAERENEARMSIYDGLAPSSGYNTPLRRNSTPVPSAVAAMLADPETPPRPKRFSTSSIKPSSPCSPLDLEREKAIRVERAEQTRASPGGSPGGGADADDEVSPRPARRISMRRTKSQDLLLESPRAARRFSPSMRIPSIRFEGISMESVFAEVEEKVNRELAGVRSAEKTSPRLAKQARRRTRVLSIAQPSSPTREQPDASAPLVVLEAPESEPWTPTVPEAPSQSPSLDSLGSGASSPRLPLDVPRPRPFPRRTSSRPAPLNVEAANAEPAWAPRSAPLQAPAPLWSPPADATFAYKPVEQPQLALISPPLAGAFSPTTATSSSLSPQLAPSPILGEPFTSEPSPSLSTASTATFRPCDIPELLVCPPSPPQQAKQSTATISRPLRRQSLQYVPQRPQPSPPLHRASTPVPAPSRRAPPRPLTIINGQTKVTVLPEKKMVRVSTRASNKRASERPRTSMHATYSPIPQVQVTPPPPPSPFLPSVEEEVEEEQVAESTTPPVSPPLPCFITKPYRPASVLRTDFHPALSTLNVGHQTVDEDSSDCEESLHNMLMRLNRPHTPPAPAAAAAHDDEAAQPSTSSSKGSLSLTELALELHTTSHNRLSMLAREMGAAVSTKENLAPSVDAPRSRSPTPTPRDPSKRYSRLYEAGSNPLLAFAPKPLSPSVMHQSLAPQSEAGTGGPGNWSSSDDDAFDAMPDVPLEADEGNVDLDDELERTLASLVSDQELSSSSSISSAFSSNDSSAMPPTRRRSSSRHRSTDSASTIDHAHDAKAVDTAPGPDNSSISRSGSHSSDLTDSSYDSADLDEGIVCLGERVSCMYNVGVIGMAM